jgi:hypothetical protein
MPNPRKLAEQKKAQIRAKAEREIAEVDRDMEALEQIAAKYGFEIVEKPAPGTPWSEMGMAEALDLALQAALPGSITKNSIAEAESMIRERNRPVPLSEVFERLAAKNMIFNSKEPKSTLSAVLSQSGKLESIRGVGWWLKGVPLPPDALPGRRLLEGA